MATGAAWSPLPVTAPAEVLSTMGKPLPNSGVPKPNLSLVGELLFWKVCSPIPGHTVGVPRALGISLGLQQHGCDLAQEATCK